MKKVKKLLSTSLAAAMALTLLVGCGSASSSTNGESTVAPSTSTAAPETSNGEWPAIGTKDAPVQVKLIIKDVMPDEEDIIALFAQVQEKMAAHGQYIALELLEPPADSYATALPLGLRSGEIDADLFYFQGGDLPVSQAGLLEDLTQHIANSTHIKAMQDDSGREKISNYPYLLNLATPRVPIPVMRKDFAAQLDSYEVLLKDPSTDNYYNLFKEMVDKDLVDAATTMDGSLDRLNTIFNHAFGVTATVLQEDGKWIYSMASEAEKNKLEFYAKLYADGLLDSAYITDKWDTMEQKFYEAKVGMIAGTAGDVIQVYNNKMTAAQGTDLVVLPPAKGISQAYTSIDNTKEPRGFAINADSENKDAAFAYLEFMASPEGRLLDKVGIEGTHYNIDGGKIVFTDRFPEWWARIFTTPMNLNPEPPLAEPVLSVAAQASVDSSLEYYFADTNILIPNDMAPQYDAMRALYAEYSTDIVTGKKPISAFDDFVKEFNSAGGDTFSQWLTAELS